MSRAVDLRLEVVAHAGAQAVVYTTVYDESYPERMQTGVFLNVEICADFGQRCTLALDLDLDKAREFVAHLNAAIGHAAKRRAHLEAERDCEEEAERMREMEDQQASDCEARGVPYAPLAIGPDHWPVIDAARRGDPHAPQWAKDFVAEGGAERRAPGAPPYAGTERRGGAATTEHRA